MSDPAKSQHSQREIELGELSQPKTKFANDESDMRRMGKKQEFQRNFRLVSIAAFTAVAQSGWCYTPSTLTYGLASGGTGGIIVVYFVNWVGLFFVILSLAEMSSIAPTAGGQYHWASEFAPAKLQRLASYWAGWLSSLSWIAGFASAAVLIGTTFQGFIVLNDPTYVPQKWQAWLFVVMIVTFSLAVNTMLARFLPRLEGVVFMLFTLAFIAVEVVLWTLGDRLTASEVFATFTKDAGWSSLGLTLMTGQSAIMFLIVGSDATAHMAEETKEAAIIVPKAMIASYLINGGLSFIILVTYCFLAVKYDEVLQSPAGLLGVPFIQVFVNATRSTGGGIALLAIMAVVQIFGCCNWMASNARQIFAFARDGGVPFHRWVAKVDTAGTYPVNAIIVVWAGVCLLPLIYLGSTVAFTALTSLQIISLIFTYIISLSAILWRRIFEPNTLPSSPWSLGPMAIPINIIGWCYCLYQLIFLPWPVYVPVTAENFNWASVMFVGVMALSALYYFIWGKRLYQGPVSLVRPRDE